MLTLAQAATLLAERGYTSAQGTPYAQVTLRAACVRGDIVGAKKIGRAWVVTEKAVLKWAANERLHVTGAQAHKKRLE